MSGPYSFGRRGVKEYFFAGHNIPNIVISGPIRIPNQRQASSDNSDNGLLAACIFSTLVYPIWWVYNRESSIYELIQVAIPH